jgi:hypothetical protein
MHRASPFRFVAGLIVTALLALATLGVAHGYEHDGETAGCATCVAIHAAPVRPESPVVAPVPVRVVSIVLAIAPGPELASLARPSLRAPPSA